MQIFGKIWWFFSLVSAVILSKGEYDLARTFYYTLPEQSHHGAILNLIGLVVLFFAIYVIFHYRNMFIDKK